MESPREADPTTLIKQGMLKTAQKNLSVGSTMSTDHKVRFASKVMIKPISSLTSGRRCIARKSDLPCVRNTRRTGRSCVKSLRNGRAARPEFNLRIEVSVRSKSTEEVYAIM